ncbi:retron Ec78 anti-phage system effector HNH endonuclease PtuB [Microbulbifer sp. JMSA004]|uniref:retron Ec78 anti-phage system effector HNH endonuclease PtuB n=1 Tax=Microbulbifer sp. JMSA004 TaxID=3243370 RepID=UPI00403A22B4
MHKLNRPIPPACLSQYQHGRDNWHQVTQAHKNEIWLKIDEMQNGRCAYCEATIRTTPGERNAHLEHFRQKRTDCYPQGTFLWSNLFGSCGRDDSCGKHKDRQLPYNYQDLIKMDQDDPVDYLSFLSDGNVVPAKGLHPDQKKRAVETIRIFNLNGSLRQIRETMLKGYIETAEEFADYAADFEEEEWLPLLEEELENIKNLPFTTAIKHVLLPA